MINNGYVQVYRSILGWLFWDSNLALKIYLYLIIKANWQDTSFDCRRFKRGELPISIKRIAKDCACSEKSVQRWLRKFEEEGEITAVGTNKYTIITINNYSKYQDVNPDLGGFVKLNRTICDWKHWSSDDAVKLLIYLIMSAEWRAENYGVICGTISELTENCSLKQEVVLQWLEIFAADGLIHLTKDDQDLRIQILDFLRFSGKSQVSEQMSEQMSEQVSEQVSDSPIIFNNYEQKEQDDDIWLWAALNQFRGMLLNETERIAETEGYESATNISNSMEAVISEALDLLDPSTLNQLSRAPDEDIEKLFGVVRDLTGPIGEKTEVKNKAMYLATSMTNHFRARRKKLNIGQPTMFAGG